MLEALLTQLIDETTQRSLRLAAPELALIAGIVLMLLGRVTDWDRHLPAQGPALFATLAAFLLSLLVFADFNHPESPSVSYFSGLMVFDRFAAFVRLLLTLFLLLVLVLTTLTGIPDRDDSPDFYTQLLGCTVGLLLMTTAKHLLMAFLAIEMASAASYALVGFLKGRKTASEAALKFVVFGAGAAGVTLYGMSLVAGVLGTAEFAEMAVRLRLLFADGDVTFADPTAAVLSLGVVMIFTGLAFKLSVLPFHFWTPDAYEGASAEVAGFLSVASKIASFALMTRLVLAMALPVTPGLEPLLQSLGIGLGIGGAVTTTYGNFAAYNQTDLKRLLAYSTIAHAGTMTMAVAAMLVILTGEELTSTTGPLVDRATHAVESLLFYLTAYLFMNWGAFAIVALLRNETFREDVTVLNGLGYHAPGVAGMLALQLLSLVGLPPLAGFLGKLFVFAAVYDAGSVHPVMYVVLVVGVLNTLVGLVYYVGLLKRMYLLERSQPIPTWSLPGWSTTGLYVGLITLPTVLLGVAVAPLANAARLAASALFR